MRYVQEALQRAFTARQSTKTLDREMITVADAIESNFTISIGALRKRSLTAENDLEEALREKYDH